MRDRERSVIEQFFQAMRAGAAGGEEMMRLFAADAVYVDPFGAHATAATPVTHVGRAAIRQAFRESQKQAPPNMTLTLDQVDVDGERVRTEWTCASPAFPRPMRGEDLWTIRDGHIVRLETRFVGEE